MLRVNQRLCARSIASGSLFRWRLLPSELNCADGGSRLWEPSNGEKTWTEACKEARRLHRYEVTCLGTSPKEHHFGVNILAHHQQALSDQFASPSEDRFEGISWNKSALGNPELSGSAAFFDCTLEARHPAGDHMIMIGRIKACHDHGKSGLGYHRGGYFTLEQR